MPTGTPLRRTLSNTAASERSENRSSSGLCNANIYIRQDHGILNIAQLQHHPTFIGISYSLYISFIQANTQFISASTMYVIQSNANSCMPSAPLARSGLPPRCCKHRGIVWCVRVGVVRCVGMGVVRYVGMGVVCLKSPEWLGRSDMI